MGLARSMLTLTLARTRTRTRTLALALALALALTLALALARCAEREWAAAACARPVALKQCLGLPKPLWHEVMELCGDWCAELSQIEIQKRTDLED